MARGITEAEALTLIDAEITKAGGSISHNDLAQRLEASGKGAALVHVLTLARNGSVVSKVETRAGDKPVLMYRKGGVS